jgi:hypothetical protein
MHAETLREWSAVAALRHGGRVGQNYRLQDIQLSLFDKIVWDDPRIVRTEKFELKSWNNF